jgi:hypothetical protein
MSHKHVEDSLAKIRVIFEEAAARIDALKPGEKIPATKLAEDIGDKHDMTGAQLYPTLKFLFDGYPGVDVKRGAHGGIIKQALPVIAPAVQPVIAADLAGVVGDSEVKAD